VTASAAVFTVRLVVAGAAARKLGSAPVLLNVAVTPLAYVPAGSAVADVGLQLPDAVLPVPEPRVITQTDVARSATVTVSPLGAGTPFPAVTVAENTKAFSAP
jgi:hypothetical protein